MSTARFLTEALRQRLTMPWLVAGAVCLVASASLFLRSGRLLFDRPLDEDGFYALTIARNIAAGMGVTIDGEMVTNGFQPLWVFLLSPVFVAVDGDRILGVRAVLLLSAVIWALGGVVLGLFAARLWAGAAPERRRLLGWATAVLYWASTAIWMHSFNGLETGLLLLGYAGCLLAYTHLRFGERKGELLFGGLLGLLVLVRVDAALFVVAIAAMILLTRGRTLSQRLASAAIIAAIAASVSSPWWIWNVVAFGHPLPTSGLAFFDPGMHVPRLHVIVWAALVNLTPLVFLGVLESSATALARAAVVLAVIVIAWILGRSPIAAKEGSPQAMASVLCLLATCIALAISYALLSRLHIFYFRYLAPLSLIGVLLLAYVSVGILDRLRQTRLAPLFDRVPALLCVPVVVFAVIAHTGLLYSGFAVLREQVPLVMRAVPAQDWVAAGQTGTLGYLRDRVLNLDGKVNRDALRRREDLTAYLAEKNIRWFADWRHFATDLLGEDLESKGWRLVDREGSMELYRRD